MSDQGLGTEIVARCPYCGRHNWLSWRWGDKGPRLITCGLDEIFDKTNGCLSYFIVRARWEPEITSYAIEGEGKDG